MKIRIALVMLVLLALAVAAQATVTVKVNESNFAALGWTKTVVTGPEAGGMVQFSQYGVTVPPAEGVQISPKKSQTGSWGYASLGYNFPNGTMATTITHLKIRTAGFEGDGGSWEAPSIYLGFAKDAGVNGRAVRYLPYASTSRTATWTFQEYDCMAGTSKWFAKSNGAILTGWSQVLAINAALQFYGGTYSGSLPGGMNFQIMSGATMNEEIAYGSSARGMVDWVEIGFNGAEPTRYDFTVPEPGSLLALATGLIGFLGLRKRF